MHPDCPKRRTSLHPPSHFGPSFRGSWAGLPIGKFDGAGQVRSMDVLTAQHHEPKSPGAAS